MDISIYAYREVLSRKRKWEKEIYNKLLNSKKIILLKPLENSCKKQLRLFLFSSIIFNFIVNVIKWKIKRKRKDYE